VNRIRIAQLSAFYKRYRIEDQQGFYDARRREYEQADGQVASVTTLLLLLAAVAGVLGTAEVLVGRAWWGPTIGPASETGREIAVPDEGVSVAEPSEDPAVVDIATRAEPAGRGDA
jgi:hypothetical protein